MGPDDTDKRGGDRPHFSGKEKDFGFWSERFEAFCHGKKLSGVLSGQSGGRQYEAQNYTLWCELVQCLDNQTLMLIKR